MQRFADHRVVFDEKDAHGIRVMQVMEANFRQAILAAMRLTAPYVTQFLHPGRGSRRISGTIANAAVAEPTPEAFP
jgi:hypothetical protein